ncbi:SGNH/GDSL hydrolase family protein [Undibacterium sp. Jales W-56]|uniref:SGNH/GDSL hydrolase family protein n=1 Tax=Undibacterium sp. Jales W-56 TaxID=2897325 RepID=UPI0021D1B282|nr:SGNH/GDSL hydrolase family protein [Undibacterium sp. Jales W-56]MCU6434364.1 SGNH/GDSL hydrolase family protein [Undibacterium sp. Jales W-56]
MLCAYWAELVALPLLPLLSWQGKRVRANTPRLPEASGLPSGVCAYSATYSTTSPVADNPGGKTLRLIGLGESTIAGVGVDRYEQSITAQFALALSGQLQADVAWQALGKNGADIAEAIATLLPLLPEASPRADILLIAFGVNDTTAFKSNRRYRADLTQLIDAVEQHFSPKLIVISGVPPLHAFPALPQPLRMVLGIKARSLDNVARQLASARPRLLYVATGFDIQDAALMAHDGYHPSAKGAQAWAAQLTGACLQAQLITL